MSANNIPFSIYIYIYENQLKLFQICSYWIFLKGLNFRRVRNSRGIGLRATEATETAISVRATEVLLYL